MKKREIYRLVTILIIITISILVGVFIVGNQYLNAQDKLIKNKYTDCKKLLTNHTVEIKSNQSYPVYTNGKLCDTLTIKNTDNTIRIIAFGPHEDHIPYDGVTEKVLSQNQSFTFTFNELGTFTFHDHLHDDAVGSFNVSN